MSPLVSVVIVNRNGIDFVDTCLRSVLNNRYPNFEVIFVDNASSDGSREYVQDIFGNDSRMRFVLNKESVGPAVGRNNGIALSKGEYVAFLDNDTEVDKDWLWELIRVFGSDLTIGSAQSKLLRMEPRDTYDCAGDYLTPFGFLSERARAAKDTGQFDYVADILSAKSAASIVRKDVLNKIGGFDEDFYMYLEETDFSWRVWLVGYRVVFVPKSVVYHAYGTKKKSFQKHYSQHVIRYYGCRNYISTLIKNLEFKNIIRIVPLHIAAWLGLAFMFLAKNKVKDGFLIIKGVWWNALNIGMLLRKHHFLQKNVRKSKDREILGKIMTSNTLSYYLGKGLSYIHGRPY